MTVSGRGSFRFEAGGRVERSLADASEGRPILPSELARFVALLGAGTPGATFYGGVRWRFVDEAPARGFVPTEVEGRDRPIETMRAAIDDAVERVAGEASRIAVMTGGGLDSGGLLAYAVRWSKRKPGRSVFAVGLDFEAAGDDRPHLAALVDRLACDAVRVRPEETGAFFRHAVEGVDGAPFVWCTAPFEAALLARAKAEGAEVTLTGVGGDELLDGNPLSLAHVLAEGRVREAWSAARDLSGFDRPRFAALQWLVRPHVAKRAPRWLRARRMRRLDTPPPFAGPTLTRAYEEASAEEADRVLSALDRTGEFRTRRHRFAIAWLRRQESIAGGLERRDPFLDLGLVETLTSMPASTLLHGARRRGLFRETLRGEVPETFRLRMDKSYFEPAIERSLLSGGGFRIFEPFAAVTRLADLGIVEPTRFRRALEALIRTPGDGAAWASTFPWLTVEAFLARRDA